MENKKELKFIHITKCAGTSIENAGYKIGLLWGRFHKEYGYWHRLFPNINREIINKYDWFMVVRNPYERILSEYYCKWAGIGISIKKEGSIGIKEGGIGGIGGTEAQDNTIKHTIEEMNLYLIKKINNRNNNTNKHYIEQYRYLDTSVKIHIIKFENLNKQFNNLMNLYSIKNIKLETHNKSTNKKFTILDFSKELIDLINKVYHLDFKKFNYNKILLE